VVATWHDASEPLRVEDLTVGFGSHVVLDGVSLRVAPGELVGLVGDNGAGKTTLVRALAGELLPFAGRMQPTPRDLAVVWQEVELVDDLSIAENLVLGAEPGRLLSPRRTHRAASEVLSRLALDLGDLSRPLRALSGGQRRLVTIARQVARNPRYLLLDEPTASLGAPETQAVVALVERVRRQGVGVLLVSHDLDLVARLADRVLVLRRGGIAAEVAHERATPEDLAELIAGGEPARSARRQLQQLAALADQIAHGGSGSAVEAIVAACSAALGTAPVAALVGDERGGALQLVAAVGLAPEQRSLLARAAVAGLGAVGLAWRSGAMATGSLDEELPMQASHLCDVWAYPVVGTAGRLGVLTVLGSTAAGDRTAPHREVASLYAANVATVLERERALAALERRNRVLEVLRRALEVLAGGADVERALQSALEVLREGIGAVELELAEGSEVELGVAGRLERAVEVEVPERAFLRVRFDASGVPEGAEELLSAAASSVRLALERRRVERAEREAAALRRSQALQVAFVQRLSHELRTPLTAITGYASSLLAEDVRWDEESTKRFLTRIVAESQRLARLVGDLLDLSAIEAGTLRIRRDWADVGYLVEAAVACVPDVDVDVALEEGLPAILVDHDRIEQVLVNLLHNASYHNPPGTRVRVSARRVDPEVIAIAVEDDGAPLPAGTSVAELAERGRHGSGSGLGLAISARIVAAHGGELRLVPSAQGKRFEVILPERAQGATDAPLVGEGP